MRRYLGGDVHSTTCTFAQLSADGKRLRQDVIETNARALVARAVRGHSTPGRVGVKGELWA